MRQAALTIDQDIQAMRTVPCHNHIGFPVPTLPARRARQRAQRHAGPVFDPLAGLSIRPLRFPLGMVAGKIGNQVLRPTINVLINRFLAYIG